MKIFLLMGTAHLVAAFALMLTGASDMLIASQAIGGAVELAIGGLLGLFFGKAKV